MLANIGLIKKVVKVYLHPETKAEARTIAKLGKLNGRVTIKLVKYKAGLTHYLEITAKNEDD